MNRVLSTQNGQPGLAPPDADATGEVYRALLARLGWPATDGSARVRSLGITSCSAGAGVTTVAVQLAAVAAGFEQWPVLLVDANRPHPNKTSKYPPAHELLGASLAPGLAEALIEGGRPTIQTPTAGTLSFLAVGKAWLSDEALLAFPGLLETLKTEFDLIVLDLPPLLTDVAASRLAASLDGVLLVVESGRTLEEDLLRGKDLLSASRANLLGSVLNKQTNPMPGWLRRLVC
jgi:Mrp family chromosome partitioning ATPase